MKNLPVIIALAVLVCQSSVASADTKKVTAAKSAITAKGATATKGVTATKSRQDAGAPRPNPTTKSPMLKVGGPLQGGVTVNVPRTPEEVGKYLLKMKRIVHDYERVALSTLLSGNAVRTDADSLGAAKNQTLDLITRIRSLTPPAELKNRHYDLANTMESVGGYLQNPGNSGGGLEALTSVGPMLTQLRTSLNGYHSGVRNCMAYYGLSDSYDPFGDEDENAKARLSGAIQGLESDMLNRRDAGSQGGFGGSSGSFGGAASADGSSGGLGGLGDIGQLLGGLGLGNIDPAALQKMLGGMDTGQLGSLLNGLGGGSGGSGLGGSGAGGLGQINGLDLNSLGKLGGSEMNTLRGNDGNSGFGSSEGGGGGQSGGLDLNSLQNIFQQLQGGQ